MEDLAHLIALVSDGEPGARDRLFSAAYGELRKLARSRLRHGGRDTFLGTTALVNESYLRLAKVAELRSADRAAFFGYASRVMRSVIIESIRERRTLRRNGGNGEMSLDECEYDLPAAAEEVLRVHEALSALEKSEPRLGLIVEMLYFGGYTKLEVGQALELNEKTIRRDWEKARLILAALLGP